MATDRFYKMSGSGNDFVVFDARESPPGALEGAGVVRSLAARGTGIGADGVVFLVAAREADFRMRYYNSDGSPAAMCGNAALCVTRLAVLLGAGDPRGMRFESDSGVVAARLSAGMPEVDLEAVRAVQEDAGVALVAGERRIGFALAGVPHLVVLCDDLERVALTTRGPELRNHPVAAGVGGANVNFVARTSSGWGYRTFERGVEGETLACGTGAIATALLLHCWGEAPSECDLLTRSGQTLGVRLREIDGQWHPTLRGEGRVVFTGTLA